MKRKLPKSLTVQLLKHMSEAGRFEQTRSEFPEFELDEIRQTFAWLAEHLEEVASNDRRADQKIVQRFARSRDLSPEAKRVLEELPAEEGVELLRNFGALD